MACELADPRAVPQRVPVLTLKYSLLYLSVPEDPALPRS